MAKFTRQMQEALDLMSPENLRTMIREQMEWVKNYLKSPQEHWSPMMTVTAMGGFQEPLEKSIFALAVPFNEDEEKQLAMEQFGASFHLNRKIPLIAVMTTEVWITPDLKGCQPRDHPERQEALASFGRTWDGKHHAIANLPVKRDKANNILPGEWSPIHEEGVQCKILEYLFHGFYLACTEKFRN